MTSTTESVQVREYVTNFITDYDDVDDDGDDDDDDDKKRI
jgi:hypothetical protein